MRLQDKNKEIPTFETLGIQGKALTKIEETLSYPNGIFLVT